MTEAVGRGFTRRCRRFTSLRRRPERTRRRIGHPPLQRQDGTAGHAGVVPGRNGWLDEMAAQATDALHGRPPRGGMRLQLRWIAHRIAPRPAGAEVPPRTATGDRVIAGCSDHLGRSVALGDQWPPARRPHRHAAGDVHRLPALRVQIGRHPGGPAARSADDIHRIAVGHLVKTLGQCGHRHVNGGRRVSGGPFVVFPDIEQYGVGGNLGDGHFRDLRGTHSAIFPPTVTGTARRGGGHPTGTPVSCTAVLTRPMRTRTQHRPG